MKIIRQAFGELSRQHMILILAVLFFNFDYAHLSEGFPQDYFIVSIAFFKVLYDIHTSVLSSTAIPSSLPSPPIPLPSSSTTCC